MCRPHTWEGGLTLHLTKQQQGPGGGGRTATPRPAAAMRPRAPGLAVLLLALLLAGGAAGPAEGLVLRACGSNAPPFLSGAKPAHVGHAWRLGDLERAGLTGLDLAVLRGAVDRMGPPPGPADAYEVTYTPHLTADGARRAAESGACDVLLGGRRADGAALAAGLAPAYPYLPASASVLFRGAEAAAPAVYGALTSAPFLNAACWFALFIFGVGHLIWLLERWTNDGVFPQGYKGVAFGLWWASSTVTLTGHGDKTPKTFLGLGLGFLFAAAGVVALSSFSGIVASQLVAAHAERPTAFHGLAALRGRRVCAGPEFAPLAAAALADVAVGPLAQCVEDLTAGRADFALHGSAEVQHALRGDLRADAAFAAAEVRSAGPRGFHAFLVAAGSGRLAQDLDRGLVRFVGDAEAAGAYEAALRAFLCVDADCRPPGAAAAEEELLNWVLVWATCGAYGLFGLLCLAAWAGEKAARRRPGGGAAGGAWSGKPRLEGVAEPPNLLEEQTALLTAMMRENSMMRAELVMGMTALLKRTASSEGKLEQHQGKPRGGAAKGSGSGGRPAASLNDENRTPDSKMTLNLSEESTLLPRPRKEMKEVSWGSPVAAGDAARSAGERAALTALENHANPMFNALASPAGSPAAGSPRKRPQRNRAALDV